MNIKTTETKRITFLPNERNVVTKIVQLLLKQGWAFEAGEIGNDDLVYGKYFDELDTENVILKSKTIISSTN